MNTLIRKFTTKVIEKNPPDLMVYFNSTYYGFQNIDIIICKTAAIPFGYAPYVGYANDRLGFFVPSEGLDKLGRDEIARLALQAKLYIYYQMNWDILKNESADMLALLCLATENPGVLVPMKNNIIIKTLAIL